MEHKDDKITDSNENTQENQEHVQEQPELSENNESSTLSETEPTGEVDESPLKETEEKPIVSEEEGAKPEIKVEESIEPTSESHEGEESDTDEHEDDKDDEEEEDPLANLHLENASKNEVYLALKQFASEERMRIVDRALKEIKPFFDKLHSAEREAAFKSFIDAGNEEGDFQYKGDEQDANFFLLYNTLRDKKQKFFSQLNKDKEQNLRHKNEILDKIRELVDGEETNVSIDVMKGLQSEWKGIGQVPGQHAKTLWANFNALLDRFYDNRSIYFELKELDRRKNLEAKLELCEKAEKLAGQENIKAAIFQLNELHEEFKHIGPVPKDEQDQLWDRFKAASDNVYGKRKDYFDELKSKQSENVDVKMAIGDEAEALAAFTSDRISDWNKKTKQVLDLQKKWDAVGGLPREKAKEVNKHFWSNFKKFFANKSEFFKSLESERAENLEKKKVLLKKAEELKDSGDWDKTSNELKRLQEEWRTIGPVSEKYRNDIYHKFKAACDAFFERKRSDGSGQNSEYKENLLKKEQVCSSLEAYLNSDEIELDQVYTLLDRYADAGYVPKESIDAIHKRFDGIMDQLVGLEDLSDAQRAELEIKIQVNKLKNSPHGAQKINRKEGAIKRKIGELESEIATWKTNLDFFANSKNADKLKEDFLVKIEKAEAEISEMKNQLEVFKHL